LFRVVFDKFIFGYIMMKRATKDPSTAQKNSHTDDVEIIQEEDRIHLILS